MPTDLELDDLAGEPGTVDVTLRATVQGRTRAELELAAARVILAFDGAHGAPPTSPDGWTYDLDATPYATIVTDAILDARDGPIFTADVTAYPRQPEAAPLSVVNARELRELVEDALTTDGDHHARWFLGQIAARLGIDAGALTDDLGVAP